jgi:hypothetical protein
MKACITALFVLVTFIAKAQTPTESCWTPEIDTIEFRNLPWYDNNNYLEQFLDSIGYPAVGSSNRIVGSPVKFWIPIKFWIYRELIEEANQN